jgi:hypothetical protein
MHCEIYDDCPIEKERDKEIVFQLTVTWEALKDTLLMSDVDVDNLTEEQIDDIQYYYRKGMDRGCECERYVIEGLIDYLKTPIKEVE